MPELPEVQTVVSDLNKKIVDYTVADFWSDWPKAIKNKKLVAFQQEIKGRKIINIRRLGKNIFIDLSGGKTLYIHLKMTGHLLIKSQNPLAASRVSGQAKSKGHNYFDDKVNQYIHHIWKLKKGKEELWMEFSDMRKFAKIVLDDTSRIKELPEIKKLGVDALSPEFTFKKIQEILAKKKTKAIGIVLMEQELIAGIGNIYRSEILFDAKIHPERKVEKLPAQEMQQVYKSIKKILKQAIKMRGTSQSDYRDTSGAPGSFQKVLKVYRRSGEKCGRCGIIITRKTMGQRSIFFCSKCQK